MSSPKELVYNTTDPKVCVPEQRYLTEIARICSNSPTGRKEILHILNQRLDTGNFYTCFKSLYVLHYILTECYFPNTSPVIIDVYDEFVATFDEKQHSLSDIFSAETREMYQNYFDYFFVRLDICYTNMFKGDVVDPDGVWQLEYQNSTNKDLTSDTQIYTMEIVTLLVQLYLRLFKTILKTKVYPGITQGPNNLFFAAYKLLYNDFMLVYDILISCVKLAVEDFLDMDINQQREICGLYDEYVNITVAAVDFWALGRECGFDLKRIEPYDKTLSSTLWDYYNSPHKANNHEGITQNNATGTGSVIARKKLEAIRNMRPDIQLLMKNAGLANNPPGYDDFSNHSGLPPQQIGYQQLGGQRPVPQLPPQLPSRLPPSVPSQLPPSVPSQLPPSVPSQLPPSVPSQLPPSVPSQLPPQIGYQQVVTQQQTVYQQVIIQQNTGYQQDVTQQNTGYQQDVTQHNTGYQEAITQQKTGYQQNVTQQQTGYQQNVTQQQTGYQQVLTQQKTGYQQVLTQQKTGYQEAVTQQQTGYQQAITQQKTGYQQNVTQQQTGYQQAITQQKTGYQEAVTQQQTGYQQNVTQQQTGYQQAITQQKTGYQEAVTQQQTGYQQVLTQQKTGYQQPQYSGYQQPVLLQETGSQLSVPQQPQHSGYQQPLPQQTTTESPSVADFVNANKENDSIPSKPFNPFSLEHYQKEYLEEPEFNQDTVKDNLVNKNPFGVEQEGIDYGQVNPKMIISQFNHLHDNKTSK